MITRKKIQREKSWKPTTPSPRPGEDQTPHDTIYKQILIQQPLHHRNKKMEQKNQRLTKGRK